MTPKTIMKAPRISVVIPTLNQGPFIEETLASVFGQNWPQLEVIVVDGGSKDQTREIVERYPVTHFISEPDRGQADAINKGMRLARGDILTWLNSDDYYLPLTLQRVAAALGSDPTARLVYGGCLYLYTQDDRARVVHAPPYDRERLRVDCYLTQPSTFWTRPLWEKTGEINDALHFIMDWEYWVRASQHCAFEPLDLPLSVYRFHPGHKTSGRNLVRTSEIVSFVEQYASPEWAAVFRDVNSHLDSLIESWDKARASGRFAWHKLRHRALYRRYGAKVDAAFWQLHV
jgi:glycosyltransferase involved in cell wall biosynthesis